MKYLVIDAALSGTGIRDKYEGGFLAIEGLGISCGTMDRLNQWLSNYENGRCNGFADDQIIDELDREGKNIALAVKNELSEVKIEYFSDARMTSEMVE